MGIGTLNFLKKKFTQVGTEKAYSQARMAELYLAKTRSQILEHKLVVKYNNQREYLISIVTKTCILIAW